MTGPGVSVWVTRSGLESRHIGQPCLEGDRMTRANTTRYAIERIEERCTYEDRGYATPCRTYSNPRRDGYGTFTTREGTAYVHRTIYEHYVGPIPEGMQIDHLCRNRACCEPAHLEAVTQAENIRRGTAAQVLRDKGSARTACRQGHPYNEQNTRFYLRPSGLHRSCKICQNESRRRWRQRKRDES